MSVNRCLARAQSAGCSEYAKSGLEKMLFGDERSQCRTNQEIKRTASLQLPALFRTTRPLSSLVAGTLSASAVIAAQGRLSFVSVAAGVTMTTLTMFGFVVNDVVDFDKD